MARLPLFFISNGERSRFDKVSYFTDSPVYTCVPYLLNILLYSSRFVKADLDAYHPMLITEFDVEPWFFLFPFFVEENLSHLHGFHEEIEVVSRGAAQHSSQ